MVVRKLARHATRTSGGWWIPKKHQAEPNEHQVFNLLGSELGNETSHQNWLPGKVNSESVGSLYSHRTRSLSRYTYSKYLSLLSVSTVQLYKPGL